MIKYPSLPRRLFDKKSETENPPAAKSDLQANSSSDFENPLMGDEGGAGISAGGLTNSSAGRFHDDSWVIKKN